MATSFPKSTEKCSARLTASKKRSRKNFPEKRSASKFIGKAFSEASNRRAWRWNFRAAKSRSRRRGTGSGRTFSRSRPFRTRPGFFRRVFHNRPRVSVSRGRRFRVSVGRKRTRTFPTRLFRTRRLLPSRRWADFRTAIRRTLRHILFQGRGNTRATSFRRRKRTAVRFVRSRRPWFSLGARTPCGS